MTIRNAAMESGNETIRASQYWMGPLKRTASPVSILHIGRNTELFLFMNNA